MKYRDCFAFSRPVSAGAATLAVLAAVSSVTAEENIAIEELLRTGWQVAGYTSTVDNRSAFILFKHPDETYLIQCRTGYDVTRTPRTFSNCYELR
jgi:hypothetical protein